jgi:RNA polymerase sigma factor (sigma-70 family)
MERVEHEMNQEAAGKNDDLWAAEITAAMLSGEERAYSDFYHAYCDRLFRYLIVLTRGNEDAARDLLQQVFIKAIRNLRNFDREEVLWSWLTQICKTSFIDLCRKTRRAQNTIPFPENWVGQANDRSENELVELLQDTLEQLPSTDRELIDMAYFEKESRAEMARKLQTTPKAVESKLARLRSKLKTMILSRLNTYAIL